MVRNYLTTQPAKHQGKPEAACHIPTLIHYPRSLPWLGFKGFLNDKKKFKWRNDLDDILLDQKSEFLDFLETQISQPFEPPEPDVIKIRAYSYINFKGTVVNVRSHTRKRK